MLFLTFGDPCASQIASMSNLKASPRPLPAATISGVLPVESAPISISDIWGKSADTACVVLAVRLQAL